MPAGGPVPGPAQDVAPEPRVTGQMVEPATNRPFFQRPHASLSGGHRRYGALYFPRLRATHPAPWIPLHARPSTGPAEPAQATPDPPSVETHSLATRAARGLFWTASPFLIQLVIILVFYSTLAPHEMGRFEVALIVVMLAALISDLGMNAALVQCKPAADRHFTSAFWTSLGVGLCLTLLLAVAAPFVARLLTPEYAAAFAGILVPLSLLIPFASVSGILRARLQRDLRFRPISLAEICSVVVYSAVALALLPSLPTSLQLRALIAASVAREAALLAGLWVGAGWRPQLAFSPPALRELLGFGLNFTGERILGFLNSRITLVFTGWFVGDAAAGHYGFASRVTLIPLVRLSTVIHRVGLPTFSIMQDDDALLGRGFIRSIQGVALFFWPVLMGLLIFAPQVVHLVNEQMAPALMALQLLVLATLLKAIGTIVSSIFLAKQRAHWSFRWALFSLAVTVPSLMFGVRYGVDGVAAVILATSLLFFILSQLLVHRLIRFPFRDYVRALVRPVLVSLAVLGALLGVKPLLLASPVTALLQDGGIGMLSALGSSRLVALAILVQAGVAGLVAYVVAVRLLAWSLVREYWRTLRGNPPDGAAADVASPE